MKRLPDRTSHWRLVARISGTLTLLALLSGCIELAVDSTEVQTPVVDVEPTVAYPQAANSPDRKPVDVARRIVAAEDRSSPDNLSPAIKVTQEQTLADNIDQRVRVVGQVSRTNSSRSGFQFLNFYSSSLTIVIPPEAAKRFEEPPARIYREKNIAVTGRLERYKGKLQIKVSSPDQIALAENGKKTDDAQGVASDAVRPVLKKTGPTSWRSEEGLVYQGRDPDGLTRLDHILRHDEDIPDRVGPHGVFDADGDAIFALIDEAWRIVQQKKIEPRVEGNRHAYTIPMGRRIGFLGGESGKRQRNRPLRRLFLVMESDSARVVTAFPK